MLVVVCPGCHRRLQLADAAGGHEGKCAHCGRHVRLGGAPASPAQGTNETASSHTPENDSHPQTPPPAAARGYEFLAPPQRPDEIGRLGDYRVLQLLGQGAMGMVFRAEDPGLARILALKVMLPTVASVAENRERFLREAQATALVNHPNVIPIYKIGEDRGVPYLAMPLLKGELLEARLNREKRLAVRDAVRIGREIAEGLSAAHQRNLIHRDIKPANLWLETVQRRNATDRVKILDFGLARIGDAGLTTPGAVLGTPAYMAPEQAKGLTVDYRCDLFSLGSVLYRMLTGERAFQGSEVFAVMLALTTVHPPPPHEVNPAVPLNLSRLVMHLLAKEPDDRPQSAAEVVAALHNLDHSGAAGSSGNVPVYRAGSSGNIPMSPSSSGTTFMSGQPEEATGSSPHSGSRSYSVGVLAAAVLLMCTAALWVSHFVGAKPRGTLVLSVNPPGSEVLVDSHPVELDANGPSTLTLAPGTHELKVLHQDYHGRTLTFDVAEGNNSPLTIDLERLAPREPVPPEPAPPETPPQKRVPEEEKKPAPRPEPRETPEPIPPPPMREPPPPPMPESKNPPAKETIPLPEKRPASGNTEMKSPAPGPDVSIPAETKIPSEGSVPPPDTRPVVPPKTPAPRDDRRAALWVIDCGGAVVVKRPGRPTGDEVRNRSDLPRGRFDVVMVGLEKCRKANDAGLAALEGLTELTELGLSGTSVTDRGIAKLRTLRALKNLSLSDTGISDGAIPDLKLLDGLRFLDLQNTKISSDGLQQLRAALPRCQITEP
jgi:serine/threonine protein kinase